MTNKAKELIRELEQELLGTATREHDKILEQNKKALELINSHMKKKGNFNSYQSIAEAVKALISEDKHTENKLRHSRKWADGARKRISELSNG